MHAMSRGILCFVVACAFVLLSLLTYIRVLPQSNSKLPRHPHDSGFSFTKGKLRRHRFANLTGKELLGNYVLDPGGGVVQGPSDSFSTLALNVTNATVAGKEYTVGMKIMVMARMRTGSTLLGEMLNQNPNLFYLFEPLHATDSLVQMRLMERDQMKGSMASLLRKLSKCTFPSEYLVDIYNWGIAKGKSKTIQEMCEGRYKCSRIHPVMLNKRCAQRKGNMAMKMIRADLETIRPVLTEDHLNVKILHLVRDPRGTANSRKKFYCSRRRRSPFFPCTLKRLGLLEDSPERPKYNTMPKFCTWMRETVEMALNRPDWLEGRYKLIRYEDLAMEPLRFAKEIYKFLGLPLHPKVIEWVNANTQTNTLQSRRAFNTNKNSSEAALSWRNSLSFEETQEVEQICGDVMRLVGYLPIRNKNDLTNYSMPVISPLNIGQDISFS